jgi:hypothetical protein
MTTSFKYRNWTIISWHDKEEIAARGVRTDIVSIEADPSPTNIWTTDIYIKDIRDTFYNVKRAEEVVIYAVKESIDKFEVDLERREQAVPNV